MFSYIPQIIKRRLTWVSIPCTCIVAAYFLLPHFGLSHYVSGKNWFMSMIIAATIPPTMFYAHHFAIHQEAVNKQIDSLFVVGLFTWGGAFAWFAFEHYGFGTFFLIMSVLLIARAHLKWIAAFPSAQEILVQEGERTLTSIGDPAEKKKLAAALERFKKG